MTVAGHELTRRNFHAVNRVNTINSQTNTIAKPLLNWFDRHGRKDLPWQKNRTPYRVWLSEIMLQQTQVKTVIPYFQRFTRRFPSLKSLACAPLDDVLGHWAGLGYYARARNLHKAAVQIHQEHGGRFPRDLDALIALPGIGRSTAGAILAQALEQRHPILDGNVKRVLTRYYAIEGWPDTRQVLEQLWEISNNNTPKQRVRDYTQAIMDLGATVCTRTNPGCAQCPLATQCRAKELDLTNQLPTPKPKKRIPVRQTRMLMLIDPSGTRIYMEKRPPSGIWGGLLSFPETNLDQSTKDWVSQRLRHKIKNEHNLPVLRHTFSHFHLDIHPIVAQISEFGDHVMEPTGLVWYKPTALESRGIAAPVRHLLAQLKQIMGEQK